MEYLNKILSHPIGGGGLLVVSPAPNSEFDEKAIYGTFNNYDMALTITLKGSNSKKTENLKGKIYEQYLYFKELYKNEIESNCSHYVAHFELHKCGEWLHSHAIVSIRKPNKTQQANAIRNIKKLTFEKITQRKLKAGESYKNRVLLEKLHTVETWYNYIKKDEQIMRTLDERIQKLFKLQSISTTNHLITF